MNRTAILAISLLLVLCAWPGAAAGTGDPLTFLVAFTPDGGRLVVASHRGGIRVLSVPDLTEIRSFALPGGRRLRSAAVSPSGRWLAADDDVGDLLIWNLETGQAQPAVPVVRRGWAPVYLFRPDDTFIVVRKNTLQLWDVTQGRKGEVFKVDTDVDHMTVSPDGSYLAVAGMQLPWGHLGLYATDGMRLVRERGWGELLPQRVLDKSPRLADLVFTPDGRILVTITFWSSDVRRFESRFLAPDELRVLDETGDETGEENTLEAWQYPGIRSAPGDQLAALSPDGRWKATTSEYAKRLYLYRMTPHGAAIEKFIPIP